MGDKSKLLFPIGVGAGGSKTEPPLNFIAPMVLPYGRVDFSPLEGGIGRLVRGLEISFLPDFFPNLVYFCQFAHKIFFRFN